MSSRSISSIPDERPCTNAKEAIQYRNVIELQRIVQQGEHINAVDSKNSFSLLHWAAHFGSLECMHWLLWHGAEINKQSKDGWTPAHIGAIRGRSSCMQAMAANGADLNLVDSRGKSPTHLATSHGNTKTLQEILRKGINIESRDNVGWTAAHTAAYHGKVACLQILCKWGCDINALDLNGNTLAHLAAGEGHTSCLKFVLTQSRNIKGIVKARNDQGDTPKDCALQYYKKSCVDYLGAIEYDVDNPEVSDNLAYPAHNSAYKGDLEYLRMVIETGVASIDELDERGSTPLHKAAGNGQIETLKWLIENGADTRLLNAAGETAKDVAFRFAQLSCAKLLGGQADYVEDEHALDVNNVDVQELEVEAKVRAERKLQELSEQLEIAKLNFRQLGGTLNEDHRKIEEQKKHARIVRKLEDQLEYERVKREKLESQVDEMRVHIHKLHLQLEDEKRRMDEANYNNVQAKPPSTKKQQIRKSTKTNNNNRAKKSQFSAQSQSGIFLVQKKKNEKEYYPTNNNKTDNRQQRNRIPKPPDTDKPNHMKYQRRHDSSPESHSSISHPAIVSQKSAVSMTSSRDDEESGKEGRNLSMLSDLNNDGLFNGSLESKNKRNKSPSSSSDQKSASNESLNNSLASRNSSNKHSSDAEQNPRDKSAGIIKESESKISSYHMDSSDNKNQDEDEEKSLFTRFKDSVVVKVMKPNNKGWRQKHSSSDSAGSSSNEE